MKFLFVSSFLIVLITGSSAQQNALHFDGTDYVTGTLAALPQGNAARTLEAWVKYTGNDMAVFNYGTASTNQMLTLHLYNGLYIVGYGNDMSSPTSSINNSQWHHIAMSHDGTTTTIYVDGVQVNSGTRTYATTGTDFQIGASYRNGPYQYLLNGAVDEMRVWNVARTQAQIQATMHTELIGNESGLVGYWNFNQGTAGGTNNSPAINTLTATKGSNGTLNSFALTGAASNWVAGHDYLFGSPAKVGTGSGAEGRLYSPHTADFDGDGDKDIIVVDEGNNMLLFKNNGYGSFSASSLLFTSWGSVTSGDLDGDGDLDIVHTNGKVYLNNGSGVFTQFGSSAIFTATSSVANSVIADFNGDGKNDIFFLNVGAGTTDKNQLWLNTGITGTPAFSLQSSWDNSTVGNRSTVAAGDIDGDGDLDMVTGGSSNAASAYVNDGAGNFSAGQSLPGYSNLVFLKDWDNDGDLDFFAYDNYNGYGLRMARNIGSGAFETSRTSLTSSVSGVVALTDLNGDGSLDAVYSAGTGAVYALNSGCALTIQTPAMGYANNGIAVADFNGDGKPDIFCAARDAYSTVYLSSIATASAPVPFSLLTTVTPATRCTTGSLILSATASNAGTIKWYNSGSSLLTTGASYTTPSLSSTTTYYVDATNSAGCTSERRPVVATVGTYSYPGGSTNSSQAVSGATQLTDNSCQIVTTLEPSGASPVAGTVDSKVWVEAGVLAGSYTYAPRHYEVTPQTNASTATGTLTLYYTQADFDAYNTALGSPVLPTNPGGSTAGVSIHKYSGTSSNGSGLPGTYAGSPTIIMPTTVAWNATSSRWEVTFSVTGFSGFFLGDISTFPVEWLSFEGRATQHGNLLSWATASESNNAGFRVEKSLDGSSFSEISFVAGSGNSSSEKNYAFLDNQGGTAYYRLRQMDIDGNANYSATINVAADGSAAVRVYPNPVRDLLTVENAIGNAVILNSIGQRVLAQPISEAKATLDLSGLPADVYTLQLISALGQRITVQVVK